VENVHETLSPGKDLQYLTNKPDADDSGGCDCK